MRYYKIIDDINIPNKWRLGEVNFKRDGEFWKYVRAGEIFELPDYELNISIRKQGVPINFSMADFELFIVDEKTKMMIDTKDGQFIEVGIGDLKTLTNYYILVIKNEIDCVNEIESTFDKWEVNDPIRPDKAGQYKTFYKLKIDENKIKDCDIFRVEKYNSITIISEKLKDEFLKNNTLGLKFELVS
jgi:hypothetical protein